MWYCYILRNKLEQFKNNTYNGSTNNPMRRLRQHNEEIKGGARATSGKGGAWEICAMLSGFPGHINALSCEWRIKCPSGRPGKRERKYQGVKGRITSLNEILSLERWTGKCTVDNCDFKYKLHILKDVVHFLDKSLVPANIEVIEVETIDAECVELEKEIYNE
jgi:structure-specific endonuclease subunit SLX1